MINSFHINRDYGVLPDVSKSFKQLRGDRSGRTVSRRIANGFREVFKADQVDEECAEEIVNDGMVTVGFLLNVEGEGAQVNGWILSLALFFCYQSGK